MGQRALSHSYLLPVLTGFKDKLQPEGCSSHLSCPASFVDGLPAEAEGGEELCFPVCCSSVNLALIDFCMNPGHKNALKLKLKGFLRKSGAAVNVTHLGLRTLYNQLHGTAGSAII